MRTLFTLCFAGILLGIAQPSFAADDKLLIISPHRKSIQNEFIPAFRAHYKQTYGRDILVEWLDQGGASNAVQYLETKYANGSATSGVDIMWGGTGANFVDMAQEGFLAPYRLPDAVKKGFPDQCAGVPLSDSQFRWHAAAIASFGIFYNRKVLQLEKLPEPNAWSDLADPKYFDQVSLADLRQSGTNSTMQMVVVEILGWERGWQTLMGITGNTRQFTHSSSDPVKAVVAGDAAVSMVIDFYGLSKMWELGDEHLNFILPEGQSVLDPDPVAILRGAPNRIAAERFLNFVLSVPAQKLWMLPKGAVDGPKAADLARMSILPQAYAETEGKRLYAMNPFQQKSMHKIDLEAQGKMRRAFNDLLGTIMIDHHHEIKAVWRKLQAKEIDASLRQKFLQPIVSRQELMTAAGKWESGVYRNQTLNEWTARTKAHLAQIDKDVMAKRKAHH